MVSVIPGSGAIVCSGGSAPTLTNCILWGDAPQEIFSSGNPVLSYCDVQGGWPGTGNINTDPCFAFTDDLHLTPRSPCIDAGTNIPLGGLPGPDADGNARVLDGNGDGQAVADMGAYEFDSADPTIALSPSVLEVYAWAGGPNPDPQLLSIRNPAGSTLNWQISETCSWVGAAPSAGSCQHEINPVTLSFDTAGLATGDYSCMLTIYAPPAINSPRTLRVTLHLGAARRVPTEYATIQAAISAAVQNEWVLVADGVWTGTGNTNLDFAGKNLVLRSLNGAANCVIDCQESGCGFYFHTGETSTTRVEGITIRGARTGGVYCYNSSPTIVDCIISGNAHGGGGVYCGRSRLTATNCVISGNVGSSGGGLTADSSSPTLTNCTITGNTAWYGGGVSCSSYSNATLTGCLISGNRAYNGGGVFCSSNSKPTLTNCAISENTASSSASSAAYGGGLYSNASKPMLTNCTIRGNIARHGGGAYCESSSPTLTNCTISGNSTSDDGGGVYCYDQSSPTLTNCILWGNPPEEIHIFNSSPTLTYCDIQGSWPGTGNINADPLFVDAANGNFHLAANSPCIDAGSNAAIPAGITTDIDGDPRILPGHPLHVTLPHPGQPGPPASASVVDMGAYEFRLAPPPEPKEVLIGSPIAKPSGRTDGATSPTSPAGIRR
jgi:parallel beta-helix repeat protein